MPLDGDIKNFVKTDSEVVTVLKKARELVRVPCKWAHGEGGFGTDTYCVGRAIFNAQGFDGWNGPTDLRAIRTFADAVGAKVYDDPRGPVACWNDAEGRTHGEIIEGFDKAIILAGGRP